MEPRIVYLFGVWPAPAAGEGEQLFDAPSASEMRQDTVPREFTSVAAWRSLRGLRCWYCNDHVSAFVWFIPVQCELDARQQIQSMQTYGCFCSFVCAAAFNDGDAAASPTERGTRRRLLCRLVELKERLPPRSLERIFPPANPRCALMEYGRGALSRKDYRAALRRQERLTLQGAL